MERLVKLEVLGHEYPFYTDAPEEDIREILELVKLQIEDHSHKSKNILPAGKIAVLVSLNMAGKYVRLRREFDEYRRETEGRVGRLTSKIADSLPPANNKDE